MELDLFNFIDRAIELLNKKYDYIVELERELENFFEMEFKDNDSFLAVNSRIKSANSLREKIIRNSLYMHYDDAEEMLRHMQDIIGLRIECRFTDDEVDIYRAMKDLFYIPVENGYYRSPTHKRILLDMETAQPMIQKNGFGIYKIDGILRDGVENIHFELQIKSLVNVFWGEIDHKVLYKNYNYMLTEEFFRDIMHSIKDNLSMIDRQLRILYEHVNDMDSSAVKSNHKQVKSLLSKIIHDIFVGTIRKELGFVVDFNETSDIIVDYLDYKCQTLLDYDEGENFIRLLNRINHIDQRSFKVAEGVVFDRKPAFTTDFTERVGKAVYDIMPREFGWNLFFKIIAEIEQAEPRIDFEEFFRYLEYLLVDMIRREVDPKGFSEEEYGALVAFVLDCYATMVEKDPSMNHMIAKYYGFSSHSMSQVFRNIRSYDDFRDNKLRIERMLNS
ncbi:MAG: (p)ppGpp synthetase [Peptoniphilus sp.]|nr:(p)ppGpp synthetase [Peptoniphilus sp.]MDY3118015.1 (p)ppGpp synthetase [Peptoniphilus sp.]